MPAQTKVANFMRNGYGNVSIPMDAHAAIIFAGILKSAKIIHAHAMAQSCLAPIMSVNITYSMIRHGFAKIQIPANVPEKTINLPVSHAIQECLQIPSCAMTPITAVIRRYQRIIEIIYAMKNIRLYATLLRVYVQMAKQIQSVLSTPFATKANVCIRTQNSQLPPTKMAIIPMV